MKQLFFNLKLRKKCRFAKIKFLIAFLYKNIISFKILNCVGWKSACFQTPKNKIRALFFYIKIYINTDLSFFNILNSMPMSCLFILIRFIKGDNSISTTMCFYWSMLLNCVYLYLISYDHFHWSIFCTSKYFI